MNQLNLLYYDDILNILLYYGEDFEFNIKKEQEMSSYSIETEEESVMRFNENNKRYKRHTVSKANETYIDTTYLEIKALEMFSEIKKIKLPMNILYIPPKENLQFK